jgi:hypothetical protein
MLKTVRCKFICEAVEKRAAWNKPGVFVYTAKFGAVSDNSPENKEFFDATPCGRLEIGTYKDDLFEPGKTYFLDISIAAESV